MHEIAKHNLKAAGLADRLISALAPQQKRCGNRPEHTAPFDFIFIDADKSGYPEYLQWSMKLSRPGTLIVADNVVRDGKVIDPDHPDPNIQGVRRFTELVCRRAASQRNSPADRRRKGYDGFIIAVVLR